MTQSLLSKAKILIVDDDGEMADTVSDYLGGQGCHVECAVGGKAALATLKRKKFDAVLTDLRMDQVDGLDVLASAQETNPGCPVLLMTAYGSIEGAIEAVRRGAFHYLTKPFKMEEARVWLERALDDRGLRRENEQLRRTVNERLSFRNLIGKSVVMQQLYDLLERIAPTSLPILILGESGTGKELVAQAIHFGSTRARGPFVPLNCAAVPENLLESELFGHSKGAFTGAAAAAPGLFAEADGGTLFLDEIAELPLSLQAKLLRALETSSIRPVGGAGERKVDVRVIAATNRDLAVAVQEKRFREDLYYRLRVIPVHLPPLRMRREDIPLLVEHFAERFAEQQPELPRREFTAEAVRRLIAMPWPGNVRELKNTVEQLVLIARDKRIDAREIAQALPEPVPSSMAALAAEIVPLRVMNLRYLEWVLAQTGGNKVRTAQLLGIDASTIYRMLARESD